MAKKAVCLLSGGLDSCVVSFIAKDSGYEIYGLSLRYGQRHDKELVCAENIGKVAGVVDHIFFDLDLGQFGCSSLTDKKIIPEVDHDLGEIGKKIPSTYVPARNTVFLSLALAYAETLDADAIFLGANAIDFPGYPDCRPEYLKAYQNMADLATKKGVEGNPVEIIAPLLSLSKGDIIKKGMMLDVPFEKTWSCYQGGEKACGRCDSCILRLKGFLDAKVEDPILYRFYPDWYKL